MHEPVWGHFIVKTGREMHAEQRKENRDREESWGSVEAGTGGTRSHLEGGVWDSAQPKKDPLEPAGLFS